MEAEDGPRPWEAGGGGAGALLVAGRGEVSLARSSHPL